MKVPLSLIANRQSVDGTVIWESFFLYQKRIQTVRTLAKPTKFIPFLFRIKEDEH